MLLRPHLRLLRKQLFWAALVALGMTMLLFLSTSNSTGFHAFWAGVPVSAPDPSETCLLLNGFIPFVILAILFGFGPGVSLQNAPNLAGSSRFLLTRPQSRLSLLLTPFLIATAGIALLPGISWLLLIGWLHLVHAPALGHLIALFALIPSASTLGPHPSFLSLVAATHLGRFYIADASVGIAFYTVFCSGRWIFQSRFTSIKLLSILAFVGMFAGGWRYVPGSFVFGVSSASGLAYIPSLTNIALHFAFAAAWFYATLWLVRDLEL